MSECTHDCSSCSQNCSERKDLKEKQNENSSVKKVIGIVSGKGGVGKSLVTSMLAVKCAKNGYKTAVLDNGVKIMVPPHIDTGTRVVVNTGTFEYVERAK